MRAISTRPNLLACGTFGAHERTGGAGPMWLALAPLAANGEPREVPAAVRGTATRLDKSADKLPESGLDLRWFIWLVQKSPARR